MTILQIIETVTQGDDQGEIARRYSREQSECFGEVGRAAILAVASVCLGRAEKAAKALRDAAEAIERVYAN